eukprot:TRINITY_DN24775_c0_g1_i1.p1 TRINITY_DN24775_c0_g1~~TRINITY_DN24775_c0_g1_i1.p1  ORF type:complete len:340 (+),score=64.09 TRINITY_DN24775_c0_g1_i1:40-1059(+)
MDGVVVSIGTCCVDYVATFAAFPQPDTKNNATDTEVSCGGNAANIAWALSRMGRKVHFVSVIYDDAHGKLIEDDMNNNKINISTSIHVDGRTPVSYIVVDSRTASRTILHSPASVLPSSYEIACDTLPVSVPSLIFMDGRHYKLGLRVCGYYKEKFPDADIPIMLDCERHNREGLNELWQLATIIVTTVDFMKKRYEKDDLSEAVRDCLATDTPSIRKAVIVTRGEAGSIVFSIGGASETRFSDFDTMKPLQPTQFNDNTTATSISAVTPPVSTPIVDTTGAGDAYQSGFIYKLSAGESLVEAASFGSHIATLNCLGKGARCIPELKKIIDMGLLTDEE